MHYPAELPIPLLARPPHLTVSVPGSKSITNRALVLAALCSQTGGCVLTGALQSEDTEVMIDCLRRLGFEMTADWEANTVTVHDNPSDRVIPATEAELFVGNSGTTVRFVTAMLALGDGRYRLDGVPRMRERPIEDLLDALRQLGVKAESEAGNGCPPVVITADGTQEGVATVRADVSSQFLSGLLMMAPLTNRGDRGFAVRVAGEVVSEPYIDMTLGMMDRWGARWTYDPAERAYLFDADSRADYCNPDTYAIEPDASSASYFFASAAITGGSVTVRGMKREMLQGDVKFVDCLEQMGCEVGYGDDGITIHGRPLKGIDVDMNAISDTVMTLAAVACFADGPTTIRNVAHIRHKETDRLAAVAAELRKIGAEVDEFPDGLRIHRPKVEYQFDTYNDHRMAMSLALIGLRVPGVVIRNPGCVAKTYPGFWEDFARLGEPRQSCRG
jgi:3-phosphoshikimate 1-carboxyvinyltransferase